MAERRLDVGPGAARQLALKRPRNWKLLGGVAVLLLAWFAGPFIARRLDFFRVRRIEFAGMRHLERERALEALDLEPGANVFDDLEPLERRLFAVPGVKAVTIGRRLPGTLVVELIEWQPVALASNPANQGRLGLMDETGRILPFDPAASAPDLPVVPKPDRVVARVLASVQRQEPALFAEVNTAWRAGGDVVLLVRDQWFWFGPEVSAEEIRAVMAVSHDLARRGLTYFELDARFAGQVIVRRMRPEPRA